MSAADTGTDVAVTSTLDEERVVATAAGPTLPSRPGGAGRTAARLGTRIGLPVAVAGVIIGLWYLISEVVLNQYQRFMLPPPRGRPALRVQRGRPQSPRPVPMPGLESFPP